MPKTARRPVVLHLGLDTPEYDRVKASAEADKVKGAEFCRHAIQILSDVSPFLRQKLQDLAESLGLRPGHVLDAILAHYFGHQGAQLDVWGEHALEPNVEFTAVNGLMVTGQTLLELVQEHLTRQFEADRERAILFDWYMHGVEPSQEEQIFLHERGPWTQEEQELRERLQQRQQEEATIHELAALGHSFEGLAPRHRRVLVSLFLQVKAGEMEMEDFEEVVTLYKNPQTRSRGVWSQTPSTDTEAGQ